MVFTIITENKIILKSKHKIIGLLLPLLCFSLSIGITIRGNVIYDKTAVSHSIVVTKNVTNEEKTYTFTSESEKEEFIANLDDSEEIISVNNISENNQSRCSVLSKIFLLCNIPTFVMLIMFISKKIKSNK